MNKLSLLFISFVLLCLAACTNHPYTKNASHTYISDSSIARGQVLAAQYCQSCHLLPDPSLLSAGKWEEGVLPQMGPRLGIFKHVYETYPSSVSDTNVGRAFYPSQPLLSPLDWQHLMDYYIALAPDTLLAGHNDVPLQDASHLFAPRPPGPSFSYANPLTSYLHAYGQQGSSALLVADISRTNLMLADKQLTPTDSIAFSSAITSIAFSSDTLFTTNVGMLFPNDRRTGRIYQLRVAGTRLTDTLRLADSLRRPVHLEVADLNNDGLNDLLVCEFGNMKGALSWYENKGASHYQRHLLLAAPGALTTVVTDDNNDGLPEIYALFAQGDEQIIRFENKGNGSFAQQQLLRFPPSWGSSYFELNDMNGDNLPDIVYTCGDNADVSQELKPYHGVYIFLNKGNNHFEQAYFFHINGCYKAMAADFDGDGDKDLAAIAFFADYKNRPGEAFVYLQNNSNNQFTPFTLPQAGNGRWLTMDLADVDGDHKTDVLLGNFSAPSFIPSTVNWRRQPAFLLLKNIMP